MCYSERLSSRRGAATRGCVVTSNTNVAVTAWSMARANAAYGHQNPGFDLVRESGVKRVDAANTVNAPGGAASRGPVCASAVRVWDPEA